MENLDLNASHYVKNSSLQNGLATSILADYHIHPESHILDIGCGDGRITAELAKHAYSGKVIGLDPSRSMIDFAIQNFPKQKFSNLSFQLGMAEDISFIKQFDLIVSFSCFHWLKDPQKAIFQLSQALKPSGQVLILAYPKESPYYNYLEIASENYPEYSSFSANRYMLSALDYQNHLEKNGLEILSFEKRDLQAIYNSNVEIKEYINGWLNNYISLPKHLHESFLADVCEAVMNDPSTSIDQKIHLPYTALVIKAKITT